MRGGSLRHRINIERYDNSARDAHGNPTRVWALVRQVWSKIEPLSGKELWQAQQVNSLSNTKITMRFVKDLDETMRITYSHPSGTGSPRIFSIANISNIEERNISTVAFCVEGKPNS